MTQVEDQLLSGIPTPCEQELEVLQSTCVKLLGYITDLHKEIAHQEVAKMQRTLRYNITPRNITRRPEPFQDTLKFVRLNVGMTRIELGHRIGESSEVIAHVEDGAVRPSMSMVQRWVEACNGDRLHALRIFYSMGLESKDPIAPMLVEVIDTLARTRVVRSKTIHSRKEKEAVRV